MALALPNSIQDVETCATCFQAPPTLKSCQGCMTVKYCDTDCQRADWQTHKQVCVTKIKETFARDIESITPSVVNKIFNDNIVYVTTNEVDEDLTTKKLREIDDVGKVYIGTSGFSNLNMVGARKSIEYIIIIDASKITALFWRNIAQIIIGSETKESCLEKIKNHINESTSIYFPNIDKESLSYILISCMQDLDSPKIWLRDDRQYERIKEIFKNNCFAMVTADFIDTVAVGQIHKILERKKLEVDTIYLSHVQNYIAPDDFGAYENSLELLLSKKTIVVDTHDYPFKVTLELSRRYYPDSNLQTFINMGLKEDSGIPIRQRVRQRNGEPISKLYPIIELFHKYQNKDALFYLYGIECKHFSFEEALIIEKIVKKQYARGPFSTEIPKENLALLTMQIWALKHHPFIATLSYP